MPRIVELIATPANMRRIASQNVFAFSPVTGERYSATAGDYWHLSDTEPLRDYDGARMVLAREECRIVPVLA